MKNAQEAHEAIRPAGDAFRTPEAGRARAARDELALYELIWKRTVASQMADAKGQTVTIRLGATSPRGEEAEFGASGTVITFRGFLAAYEEGRDEPAATTRSAGCRSSRAASELERDALEPRATRRRRRRATPRRRS